MRLLLLIPWSFCYTRFPSVLEMHPLYSQLIFCISPSSPPNSIFHVPTPPIHGKPLSSLLFPLSRKIQSLLHEPSLLFNFSSIRFGLSCWFSKRIKFFVSLIFFGIVYFVAILVILALSLIILAIYYCYECLLLLVLEFSVALLYTKDKKAKKKIRETTLLVKAAENI